MSDLKSEFYLLLQVVNYSIEEGIQVHNFICYGSIQFIMLLRRAYMQTFHVMCSNSLGSF